MLCLSANHLIGTFRAAACALEGNLQEYGGRICGGAVAASWASAEGNEGDGYASG